MPARSQLIFSACRFFRTEPDNILLLLRMGAWVILLSLLLKFCSLQRALQIITPRGTSQQHTTSPTQLANLLDRVLRLNFLVFTPTCWKRAIVLHRFLTLSGFTTRIVFGVQRDSEKKLAGHAWLEHQGEPFLEAQPPDYLTTYSFPA